MRQPWVKRRGEFFSERGDPFRDPLQLPQVSLRIAGVTGAVGNDGQPFAQDSNEFTVVFGSRKHKREEFLGAGLNAG